MMTGSEVSFDKNGYLIPYDVVPIDWDVFVLQFGANSHRRQLLIEYGRFLTLLQHLLPVAHRQWVDGSFVSQVVAPGDIDVVIFVPHTCFGQTTDKLRQLKKEVTGLIDCYFVETFPPDHPKYDIGRADELTWYHFFRTDRKKRRKGILELSFDYGNK